MKAIGIILAGGNNKLMKDLSKKRAIAAMPVAGSYRAIDFALSICPIPVLIKWLLLHSTMPVL